MSRQPVFSADSGSGYLPEFPDPPFSVLLHPKAESEAANELLRHRIDEFVWFRDQYVALGWWPVRDRAEERRLADSLGFVRHNCPAENEVIYEAVFKDPWDRADAPPTVFFWVCRERNVVWLLHVHRQKLKMAAPLSRARRRLRDVKGYYQDRSYDHDGPGA